MFRVAEARHLGKSGSFLRGELAGARLARGFKPQGRVCTHANSKGKQPEDSESKAFLNKQFLMDPHRKQLHLSHPGHFR